MSTIIKNMDTSILTDKNSTHLLATAIKQEFRNNLQENPHRVLALLFSDTDALTRIIEWKYPVSKADLPSLYFLDYCHARMLYGKSCIFLSVIHDHNNDSDYFVITMVQTPIGMYHVPQKQPNFDIVSCACIDLDN